MSEKKREPREERAFDFWSGWGFFVVTMPGMFLLGLALYVVIQ